MKIYNKLIRDNIPEIIAASNKKANVKTLKADEFFYELKKKLIEESSELLETSSKEDIIEELADIYELIEFIKKEAGIDEAEVLKVKDEKNKKRGSFSKKLFLESVE